MPPYSAVLLLLHEVEEEEEDEEDEDEDEEDEEPDEVEIEPVLLLVKFPDELEFDAVPQLDDDAIEEVVE
jgi:hypothetical protein